RLRVPGRRSPTGCAGTPRARRTTPRRRSLHGRGPHPAAGVSDTPDPCRAVRLPPLARRDHRMSDTAAAGPNPLLVTSEKYRIPNGQTPAPAGRNLVRLRRTRFRSSGHVAELLALGERAELLQALVLDLPDPLTRHVERAADLVERARLLAVQPVAKLEHPPLAVAERLEAPCERLRAEGRVGSLVRERRRLVLDELPELGLLLVAHRLLERHRRLRGAADRLDLLVRRLTAALGAQLALGAEDLVQLLDDVHRHPDRACLVGERAGDRLADP